MNTVRLSTLLLTWENVSETMYICMYKVLNVLGCYQIGYLHAGQQKVMAILRQYVYIVFNRSLPEPGCEILTCALCK